MLQIEWKVEPEQYPPTELCGYAAIADQGAFLERYGRDVLPELRAKG